MKPTNPIFFLIDEMLLADRDRYITYKEILEAYDGPFQNTPRKTDTVKGHRYHDALMDAIKLIKRLLRKQTLELEYRNGKNAADGFRYPKGVEDPMKEKKLTICG